MVINKTVRWQKIITDNQLNSAKMLCWPSPIQFVTTNLLRGKNFTVIVIDLMYIVIRQTNDAMIEMVLLINTS